MHSCPQTTNLAQPWRHQAPLKTNENGCVYPRLFICVVFHRKLFCVFKTIQFQWFSNHDQHPFVIAITVHTYSKTVIPSDIFYSMAGLAFQYQHSIWEARCTSQVIHSLNPPLMNIPHFASAWQHSASTVMSVTEIISIKHVSSNLHSKISCYFCFFWKNSHLWNCVGQDQEFWTMDRGKQHFEKQCIQCDIMLFIWAIFAWKQHTQEW